MTKYGRVVLEIREQSDRLIDRQTHLSQYFTPLPGRSTTFCRPNCKNPEMSKYPISPPKKHAMAAAAAAAVRCQLYVSQ